MIAFACAGCGRTVEVHEGSGKEARCPHCGQVSPIPAVVRARSTAGPAGGDQAGWLSSEAETVPPVAPPSEASTLPPTGNAGEVVLATRATVPPAGPAAVAPSGAAPPGYEVLSELGRGGMGVVYLARQTRLNRLVALKMILSGAHAGAADLSRFRTEAEAIARLQHPNIVQVFEVGEHEGRPYFSLEFCPGGSLEKKLAGTPQPPREAAQLVEALARALHAAHQARVIHRDLKPGNVLLAADGTPKVTDFGLAKKLDDVGQTQSGAVMGTPSYMAPEQAGGKSKEIGPAADVYALGAILYECLTGRPPFKGPTQLDTILQVVADEPVPPTQLQPKTPRDLETVCLKCLQKEPRKRYASAQDLADDLRRFVAGEPITARPVGRWEKAAKWVRRNPAVAGLLTAVVLALVLGIVVSTYFAVDASQQAEQARDKEKTAQQNEAKAVAASTDLKKANVELTRSRDELEKTLARSLLRPLGLGSSSFHVPPSPTPRSRRCGNWPRTAGRGWGIGSSKRDYTARSARGN